MHETGVCRSIVDTVERYALTAHAKRVVAVHLRLGAVHDVVPEILVGAFEWMARGTVVEGARMEIERVPFTVRCQGCGCVYPLDPLDAASWSCPECHERDYRLNTGREFSIESIEVEGYAPDEVDASEHARAMLDARIRRRPRAAELAVSGKRAAGSARAPR